METNRPNWVAERLQCDLTGTFTVLVQIVKEDVDEFMKAPSFQRGGRSFRPREDKERCLVEVLQSYDLGDEEVLCSFKQEPDAIIVSSRDLKKGFSITPKWDPQDNQCRLVIRIPDQKDCEITPENLWRISKKVLFPLFFE